MKAIKLASVFAVNCCCSCCFFNYFSLRKAVFSGEAGVEYVNLQQQQKLLALTIPITILLMVLILAK